MRSAAAAKPPLRLSEGKAFDVVGFGFNAIDHVCVPPRPPGFDVKQELETYLCQPGGQVPTALVALQRWGRRTAYVGPLGDDAGGRLQRESLVAEGVDAGGCVQRTGVGSETSVILVDRVTGERTVLWHRPDGLALRRGELDRERLVSGRILFLDAADLETAILAATWAREEGCAVALDVDTAQPRTGELLERSDVVIAGESFVRSFTGASDARRGCREIRRLGPALVVATLGVGGALAVSEEGDVVVPAFRLPVVDTTSAGDLFHAGCLHGLLGGWPLEDTLRFASAAAALECTALGGRAAIPTEEDATRLASS